jgi:hypothetical protein
VHLEDLEEGSQQRGCREIGKDHWEEMRSERRKRRDEDL